MSPVALESANGHHDSFTMPPQGVVDQSKVHASARRAMEGGLIKVESEGTKYEEDGIRAVYTDRGAEVVSECQIRS